MMAVLRNHQSELFADRRCEFDGIGVLEVPRAYAGHRRFTMIDGVLPHPVLNSLHAVQRVKQIHRRAANGRVLHGSVSKDRGVSSMGSARKKYPKGTSSLPLSLTS